MFAQKTCNYVKTVNVHCLHYNFTLSIKRRPNWIIVLKIYVNQDIISSNLVLNAQKLLSGHSKNLCSFAVAEVSQILFGMETQLKMQNKFGKFYVKIPNRFWEIGKKP